MRKRFIITDPCYIMDDKQYSDICNGDCFFMDQPMPMKSKRKGDGLPILFLSIKEAFGGDGMLEWFGKDGVQTICVDSGLLCLAEIAENRGGTWNGEMSGATFGLRVDAEDAFKEICIRWNR